MSFVDMDETRLLYLSTQPKHGNYNNVVTTFGKMVDLCQEMYEKRRDFEIHTEVNSRKKQTILFTFEDIEDKQAFMGSKEYEEMFVDLQHYCKRNKLLIGTQVQAPPIKASKATKRVGLRIASIEEVRGDRL